MTEIETSLKKYIEELSSKNTDYKHPEQAINQAESLKSLSSDLYTDNIRFIYELIQNADDAGALNVILTILDNKYLIITHNGKSFDEKDLQGLCGINNGTKKKDLDKTGYKGLGFKAVFGKSNKVYIYSNGEYFRFDSSHKIPWNQQWGTNDQQTWEKENDRQFIYPWQINPIWTNENDIPKFIIDFCHSNEQQIHIAYAILLNNVDEIHLAINQLKQQPYMFLFLRNISQITFLTQSNDTISIDRNLNHGFKKVTINKIIDSQWIIKRFELDVPDVIRNKLSQDTKAPEKLRFIKKAEIFFAAKFKDPKHNENGQLISGGIEKIHEQDSILFSYLPTKIFEYKFPVLINANFLTNVNREQIHTDSIWNQWLFENIGCKILQWIKELVQDNKFRFQAYRLIPSKLNLTNNILSKRFNDSFEMTIKDCNFIRNRKNKLLKVNEVIMDSTSMSKRSSFININSMRQYIINNERNSSQYANNPFIDFDINLKQIGVKEFTWNQCIEMFKSDIFLQTYSIENNKQMIEYFYKKYSITNTNNVLDIDIEQIPFLMDQNNHLQLIKDIYFPTETIGDNTTNDSEYLFINKQISIWLNEKTQKHLKQWLKDIGVEERTDLTYLRKTIIPNVANYSTSENTIKTIKMLFVLFQKNIITKKELDQLKKLKVLTIRRTLVSVDQCFFCDQYKARLQLEEYLKTKEDKFLSFDYVINQNEDLNEWKQFFINLGIQEEIHPIVFHRKLTSFEAAGYGFSEQFLSNTSPDKKHRVDAFSGLTTITFIQHTESKNIDCFEINKRLFSLIDNFHFAQFFWSYVMKNIKPEILTQKIRIYWGHSDRRGAIDGTLLDDGEYITWFVRNIPCIPTTEKTCELSYNVFVDNKELRELCGKYMYFSSILLPQEKTQWHEIFNFKTKLSINDYFDLLEKIHQDEKYLKDNLDRIQNIYHYILKEIYYWTIDEKNEAKIRVKSIYLLTENDQWKLSSDLHFYKENIGPNNSLNDVIPCLKLSFNNRNHLHLTQFLELFNIKLIRSDDLKLADKQSSSAEYFQRKLIEISPFLKKWLKYLSGSSDIILLIDKKIQQEYDFIESDSLQLFYKQQSFQKINVYLDNRNKQLYVIRPWDSETTFIDLPIKLCQLLNIPGFEKNIRFLLKGTIEEIKKHFNTNSIEIPTDKDIVILQTLPKNDVLKQTKSSSEPNKFILSTKNNKSEIIPTTTEIVMTNSTNQKNNIVNIQPPCQIVPLHYPSYTPIPSIDHDERSDSTICMTSNSEQLDSIKLINMSSINTSNLMSFKTFSDMTGEYDELDLQTGRIGEQMVYQYLLNEYCNSSSSVKWLNQNRETHLPYDIILTKNGKTQYIEVKSTRTYNQHIFPLSINQIESFIHQRENYFIYRVYINEKEFVILDNIRWRLMQKEQLACFLRILPISSSD